VRVVAIVDPGGDHPFPGPLQEAGVEMGVHSLPGRAYLRATRVVAEEIRSFRPDVVHTHGYRSDLLDAEVARWYRVPTVTTIHGSSLMGGHSQFLERIQFRMLGRFDAVVSVSQPLTEELARTGVPGSRLHLIPNAWSGDPPRLDRAAALRRLGLPDEVGGPPVVGFVGRLIPVKGGDVLVRALQLLEGFPWTAVLVGDGRARPGLETQVAEAGLGDRVRFAGEVPDAADILGAFDLFVLPSRSEGTPIVLFEAIAAGTPAVVSAVGGVPDVVGPQEASLVPPEDPTALAEAIRKTLADPEGARRRARRASQRVALEFSPESWLRRYDHVYRGLGTLRS